MAMLSKRRQGDILCLRALRRLREGGYWALVVTILEDMLIAGMVSR
jgi:hypothetical protein